MKTATRIVLMLALAAMMAACALPSLQPEGGVVNPTAPAMQPTEAQPTPQPAQPTQPAPTPTVAPSAEPTEAAQTIVLDATITIKNDHSYTYEELAAMPDAQFVRGSANPLNAEIVSSGNKFQDAHLARTLYLERTYIVRMGDVPTFDSLVAWMQGSGATILSPIKQARQVEEEQVPMMTGVNTTVVAGVQLEVASMYAAWPSSISTDRPFYLDETGRAYQPDPTNLAHLLTNGGVENNTLTYWADAQNWPTLFVDSRSFGPEGNRWTEVQTRFNNGSITVTQQLMPSDSDATADTSSASNGCLSLTQLNSDYSDGIDTGAQGARQGILYADDQIAGAVIKLTAEQQSALEQLGWTIQGSNPVSKSAWSPENCRPLTDGR